MSAFSSAGSAAFLGTLNRLTGTTPLPGDAESVRRAVLKALQAGPMAVSTLLELPLPASDIARAVDELQQQALVEPVAGNDPRLKLTDYAVKALGYLSI